MPISLPTNVPIATLQSYLRDKIINPNMRKSAVLAKLKARKRISYNKRGLNACTWPIEYYKRDIVEVNGSTTAIDFAYVQSEDQASVPWSEYRMGESIPKMVMLANAPGETQIYSLIDNKMKKLTEQFMEAYRYRLWQDGARTQAGIYGFLSMFASSSTPSYYSPGKAVYNNVGAYSKIAPTNSGNWWAVEPTSTVTYAGVSTARGARDNNISNATGEAWPNGNFSATYCYNTPVCCDYNTNYFSPNPGLSTSTTPYHSWDSQWQQSCNSVIASLRNLRTMGPDSIVLPADMLARAENSTIGQQRFVVGATSESKALGLNALEYNGIEFLTEFGVPAGCAFAIPWDHVNLWSMQGDLISNQKDTDITTLEDLFALDAFTQVWFDSPAFFGLITAVAASGTTN